jgi:hypothetical protein
LLQLGASANRLVQWRRSTPRTTRLYTPPDRHELVAEAKNAGVARWKVYQLDTLLTPEEGKKEYFTTAGFGWALPNASQGDHPLCSPAQTLCRLGSLFFSTFSCGDAHSPR